MPGRERSERYKQQSCRPRRQLQLLESQGQRQCQQQGQWCSGLPQAHSREGLFHSVRPRQAQLQSAHLGWLRSLLGQAAPPAVPVGAASVGASSVGAVPVGAVSVGASCMVASSVGSCSASGSADCVSFLGFGSRAGDCSMPKADVRRVDIC